MIVFATFSGVEVDVDLDLSVALARFEEEETHEQHGEESEGDQDLLCFGVSFVKEEWPGLVTRLQQEKACISWDLSKDKRNESLCA